MDIISKLKTLVEEKNNNDIKILIKKYDGILENSDFLKEKDAIAKILKYLEDMDSFKSDNFNINELLSDIYFEMYKDYDSNNVNEQANKKLSSSKIYLKEAFYILIKKRIKGSSYDRIICKKENLNKIVLDTTDNLKEKRKIMKSVSKNKTRQNLTAANYYVSNKHYIEAQYILSKINCDINNYELQSIYLKLELGMGNYDLAYNRALNMLDIATTPNMQIWVTKQLSRLYIRMGDYDSALYALKKCYDKNKNYPSIIIELVTFYVITNNYIESLKLLELHSKLFTGELKETMSILLYYIKNKLKLDNKKPESYIEMQIDNYSKKRCIDYCFNYLNKVINSCDTLESIYNIASDKIVNLIPNYKGLTDTYIVDVRPLSIRINNIDTSMFTIDTLSNTNNIIKITPTSNECVESENINNKTMC